MLKGLRQSTEGEKSNRFILIGGFVTILFLIVLMAVIALLTFSSYQQDMAKVRQLNTTARLGESIRDNMRAEAMALNNMLLRRNLSFESTFNNHKTFLETELLPQLNKIELLQTEKDQLASITIGHTALTKKYDKALDALKQNNLDIAVSVWRFEISSYLDVLLQAATKLSNSLNSRMEATTQEADQALGQRLIWIILSTVVALIIGLLVAILTIVAISKQENNLRRTLTNLKTANLHIEKRQQTGEEVSTQVLFLANELKITASQQASASQGQVSAVSEVNASVNELSVTAGTIAELAGEVSTIAQKVTTESQQIEDTTRLSVVQGEKGIKAVNHTVVVSNEVAALYQQLVETLNGLNAKNVNMRRILDLLNNIANETHLLALNAAIEAAGAGEYGERFKVVAQEVKNLAIRSANSGKEVLNIVREIESATTTSVTSAQGGYEKALQMKEAATEAGIVIEEMQHISETSRHQARSIVEKVQEVTDFTEMIKVSTFQQRTASRQVLEALEGLSVIAQQNATGSNLVSSTAVKLEEVTSNLNEVLIAA
jgi:methyl-accepting chemotaxis protein